jgi:hypothetical protein
LGHSRRPLSFREASYTLLPTDRDAEAKARTRPFRLEDRAAVVELAHVTLPGGRRVDAQPAEDALVEVGLDDLAASPSPTA